MSNASIPYNCHSAYILVVALTVNRARLHLSINRTYDLKVYCDNSKFMDITVNYTKMNTLVPGAIMEQDMHIIMSLRNLVLLHYDNY